MDDLKNIYDKAKKIELTPEEKKEIRDKLVAVIKSRPSPYVPVKSPYVFKFRKTLAFIAIILVIASGVSVSFAAEQSLPGDLLYPVKIKVNEGIGGLLARSDEEQIRWLVKTAERRIEEAEKMAAMGKLNDKAAAKIEDNLEMKTEKLKSKLNSPEIKGNLGIGAEVASDLENSLAAHEEVMKKLSNENENNKKDLNSILSNVRQAAETVRETRKNFDKDAFAEKNNIKAAEVRLKLARDSVQNAEEALKNSNKADDKVKKRASDSISKAKEVITEAETKLKGTPDSDTLEKLHRAVGLSNEARVMLDANLNLNIGDLDFSSATSSENVTSSVNENYQNRGEGNNSNREGRNREGD